MKRCLAPIRIRSNTGIFGGTMVRNIAMLAVSALALAACQDEAGGGGSAAGARDQIRAVGSSTVFPFATAVAEQFVNRSEEHTSELQSLMRISYAVFCLKKKTNNTA